MKNLLFLTNLSTDWSEEDRRISDYLSKYFNVQTANIDTAQSLAPGVDGVLMRNTWPDAQNDEVVRNYRHNKRELRRWLSENKIPSYNAHDGSGDMKGKAHVLELYRAGYPVIPTVDSLADIHLLPASEHYRVKPLDAFGGQRQENCTLEKLQSMDLTGCLIQPCLEFKREVQVYYVDDQVFCLAACVNKADGDMEVIETDPRIITEAEKFRKWNTLSHGLQRIDFIELKDGTLLLMEIEDDAPYYNVPLLAPDMQQKLFAMIHKSLEKNLRL